VLKVVKELLTYILAGFHSMAKPPDAPVESVVREFHSRHILGKIASASAPLHLVSWSSSMSGFSAIIHSRRIRCLDLPFRPLMFHVMIFIIKKGVRSGGSPPKASVSVLN
jgi:hypothetical protein